jgi:hypothetical protein
VPLYTDDIRRARAAYDLLEARLAGAERRVAELQATVDELVARQPPATKDTELLRRRILQLEGEKLELREQREELARVKAEVSVADLVRGFGRAASVGEASMPDRAIRSLTATVQGHVTPDADDIGIRFQPPELGARTGGLASASFELAKVPPSPDAPAFPNLAGVLQEKQALYADPRWPRQADASRVVSAVTRALAGSATTPEIVSAASSVAEGERRMASGLRGEEASPYRSATRVLSALVDAVAAKPEASAGDVLALAAALEATTDAARRLLS